METKRARELAEKLAHDIHVLWLGWPDEQEDVQKAIPIIQTALETYAQEQAAMCGELSLAVRDLLDDINRPPNFPKRQKLIDAVVNRLQPPLARAKKLTGNESEKDV